MPVIVLKLFGSETVCRFWQLSNARAPSVIRPSGRVTCVSLEQFVNALSPMLSTLAGRSIPVNAEQP